MDERELDKVLEKFTEVNQELEKVKEKCSDMKTDVETLKTRYNTLDKEQSSLKQTIDENISVRLDKIEKILGKINWLVIAAVAVAVLNLILVSNGN